MQLVDGYVLDRSLLSRQEQVDLLAALQGLAAARYPLDGAVQDKLRALFGAREAPWIDVDFSDWSNLHRGLFLDLRRAILERRVVAFTYFNARGEVRARTAEPLQLRFKGRAWYLLAHCRSAQDLRLFKLTRMEGVQLLEERFSRSAPPQADEPPPLPEFEAPETVLRVDASLTYRVLDEFEPEQRQRQPDGSFLVRVRYPVDAWLVGLPPLLRAGSGGAGAARPPRGRARGAAKNRRPLRKIGRAAVPFSLVYWSQKFRRGGTQMNANEKFCQSCGMPLTDPDLLATEANGAKNADYCLYCYKDGAFVQDCTMEEMIDFCAPIWVREMPGMTEDAARAQMRAFFPQLKRWKRA